METLTDNDMEPTSCVLQEKTFPQCGATWRLTKTKMVRDLGDPEVGTHDPILPDETTTSRQR